MLTTPLYNLAANFLQQHQGQHLSHDSARLVSRCIDHLILNGKTKPDTARDVAMQAYAELVAKGRAEYIDCDRTTSYALFLVDANGEKHIYTVSELLSLVKLARYSPTP